jgi:stage V sporulation protein B
VALCSSLVPIIAEYHVLNKKFELVSKVELAFKLSTVIAIPSMLGLYTLAHPILDLLFPGQSQGFSILQYSAISIPFIIIAQTSTAILQGLGYYIVPVLNLAAGCILKIVFTMTLVPIPYINIYGAIFGSIVGYATAAILNVILLKKKLNISINGFETMIKPIFASILMIIAVVIIYMNVYNYTISSRFACFCSISLGVVIYFILLVVLGIFKYGYIKRLFFKK